MGMGESWTEKERKKTVKNIRKISYKKLKTIVTATTIVFKQLLLFILKIICRNLSDTFLLFYPFHTFNFIKDIPHKRSCAIS
jgi:hypothetical protein